jgi:hypothetical protein
MKIFSPCPGSHLGGGFGFRFLLDTSRMLVRGRSTDSGRSCAVIGRSGLTGMATMVGRPLARENVVNLAVSQGGFQILIAALL